MFTVTDASGVFLSFNICSGGRCIWGNKQVYDSREIYIWFGLCCGLGGSLSVSVSVSVFDVTLTANDSDSICYCCRYVGQYDLWLANVCIVKVLIKGGTHSWESYVFTLTTNISFTNTSGLSVVKDSYQRLHSHKQENIFLSLSISTHVVKYLCIIYPFTRHFYIFRFHLFIGYWMTVDWLSINAHVCSAVSFTRLLTEQVRMLEAAIMKYMWPCL